MDSHWPAGELVGFFAIGGIDVKAETIHVIGLGFGVDGDHAKATGLEVGTTVAVDLIFSIRLDRITNGVNVGFVAKAIDEFTGVR